MPPASGPSSPRPTCPASRTIPQRIFYYFSVHLRHPSPQPSFVLDITPYLEAKMQAVACYHSQFIEGRPTAPPTLLDDLRDRARYWGWAIGAGYGEPFVCREEVGLRRLARPGADLPHRRRPRNCLHGCGFCGSRCRRHRRSAPIARRGKATRPASR